MQLATITQLVDSICRRNTDTMVWNTESCQTE